jgi:UDP-MurNAc hydroxylase
LRITFLGHAGLHIETANATILCDPWLGGPAYYGSWWPFPDNDGIDVEPLRRPTYLYISHLHQDHFCAEFLREHIWKDAVVLLPDYPLDSLRTELERVGFERFMETASGEPIEVDGLRLTIPTMVSPADGPIGDSGLLVEEGAVKVFNQNDSRPVHGLDELGHVDLHCLQYSGAMGYPFLQGYPERMRLALGRRKREVGMARARRFVEQVGADRFWPTSGPACFLDPTLYWLNDLGHDDGNVFPDQRRFLDYMRRYGHTQGELVVPGSMAEITHRGVRITHSTSTERIDELFSAHGKRRYLAEYWERKRPEMECREVSLPRQRVDVARTLASWWEPLLVEADVLCAGVNGRLGIDFDDGLDGVVVDFRERRVRPWTRDGEPTVEHHFRFPRPLVEDCVARHRENWSTDLLLSFRFQERSAGAFNKYLFAFLSALSPERIGYVERFYREEAHARDAAGQPFFHMEVGGREHVVQQRCPHASADLGRFLEYDEELDTLTCTLHGWRWDRGGTCLTADGHPLYVRPVDQPGVPEARPASRATVRRQCADCSFLRSSARTPPRGQAYGEEIARPPSMDASDETSQELRSRLSDDGNERRGADW